MKSLAPLAALAAALLVSACNQKHGGRESSADEAGAGRRGALCAARAGAGPGRGRQGAHRERSRLPHRRQDGDAGSSTRAPSCTRAMRWRSSTTPIFGSSSRRRRPNRASANAALVQAEAEERRLTTLSKQGWTANADFDKARSAADQARAAVTRADRAVSLARNAIDYATLRADADGVISAVSAEPGQVVAAGAPIVRLAHADEREAAVSVPETLVDRARSDAGAGRILGSARRFRRGEAARALADVRSGDPHLPRALHACRRAGRRAARHERHRLARGRRGEGGARCRLPPCSTRTGAERLGGRSGLRDLERGARRRSPATTPNGPSSAPACPKGRRSSRSACTSSTQGEKVRVVDSLAGL